jgi:hypothetical protein
VTDSPHHCPHCGWEGTAPPEVAVVFHPCRPPPGYRHRWIPADLEGTTLEEVWHGVFADFAGGPHLPTPAEAERETTERRKPYRTAARPDSATDRKESDR